MAFSTIDKSTLYQNQVLYTGNGGTQSITGVGFQPDFTWIKQRDGAEAHFLFDAIRGTTERLIVNSTVAEVVVSTSLTAFGSDGFTVGANNEVNQNTRTIVAWNWKANGSGSANTDGSISSTVSANTTSGFSIVSYTGTGSNATVGHGLGVAPKMIIVKSLNTAGGWLVYHESIGNTVAVELDKDAAKFTTSTMWQDTSPTSSVFSIGTDTGSNRTSEPLIAYCFAEISGYSKFGSYTGNGSTDGAFIYTGFRPSIIIVKRTNGTANWVLFDNKRSGYNVANDEISPNTTSAENSGQSYAYVDLLSNGFKWREASSNKNSSGDTYIYMAFGQPIISNSGVCATAR